MFMSRGTGWFMISLKKSSLSSILLSHSARASGRLGFHQNSVRRAISAFHGGSPVLILVDQRDGATKEPVHLVAEPGLLPPSTAAVAVDS